MQPLAGRTVFNGNFLPSFAFLVHRKIESKMSINQRTHAQFPHTEKANDEQENDMAIFCFSGNYTSHW